MYKNSVSACTNNIIINTPSRPPRPFPPTRPPIEYYSSSSTSSWIWPSRHILTINLTAEVVNTNQYLLAARLLKVLKIYASHFIHPSATRAPSFCGYIIIIIITTIFLFPYLLNDIQ